MGKKFLLSAFGLVVAVGMASTPKADAALILSATIGGTPFCATDQDVACSHGIQIPDSNPAVGLLALGTTTTPLIIGGLEIFGSLQEQTIGPPLNILNSSSLSITNLSG